MRKTAFLVAGAIAFDLGVLVVASHAAPLQHYKEQKADGPAASFTGCVKGQHFPGCQAETQNQHFYKIDKVNTAESCMDHNGAVVKNSAGLQACQSKQAIPGAIEILSFSFGATN